MATLFDYSSTTVEAASFIVLQKGEVGDVAQGSCCCGVGIGGPSSMISMPASKLFNHEITNY